MGRMKLLQVMSKTGAFVFMLGKLAQDVQITGADDGREDLPLRPAALVATSAHVALPTMRVKDGGPVRKRLHALGQRIESQAWSCSNASEMDGRKALSNLCCARNCQ